MKIDWNETIGYGLIVGAACFFGGSASLGKTLMMNGISTIMLMEVRSVITAVVLFPLLLIFARNHLKISKYDIPGLVLLAIPGLALVNASYYYAVKTLPVAMAVFIQFTAPVIIFLFALITRKESASAGKVLALFLSIAGTYLMVQLNHSSTGKLSTPGLISAVISMLSFAFYVLVSHRLGKKHSSWTLIFYGYSFAALFWCLVQNFKTTAEVLSTNHLWSPALLFVLFSTLIPFSLFLDGLRRVSPTGASIASTMETVSATMFAFFFLDERLSAGQIAGAALIFSAVLILVYQSRTVPVLEEVQ